MVDRLWQELDTHADRVGDPYVRAWQVTAEGMRLYLDGEFERAAELADRFGGDASSMGIEVFGQFISSAAATSPLMALGRFEEAGTALQRSLGATPAGQAWYARWHALAGRREEARDDVHRIMATWAISAEEDWTDTASLVVLLDAAVISGGADAAKVLSRRLSDFAEMYVVEARSTVARLLGQAALLLGDPGAARAHLTVAFDVASRVGDRGEAARVRLALAQVLFEHFPDERAEAMEHLDFAIGEFRAMKMQPGLEEAMRHKMEIQGVSSTDIKTSIDAVAASVQTEQPELPPKAVAPDGTVTLLFTDIEGSTAMNERLGDRRWLELLRAHNGIVRDCLQAHEGYEVKTEGDGFMVAFGSARKALQCAVAIQRAFAASNADADSPLARGAGEGPGVRVRIGLHTGEAVKEADDFYGRHVVLASRIADEARGGEVLVSSLLKELTESAGDIGFGEGREVELKGLSGKQRVFAVVWK